MTAKLEDIPGFRRRFLIKPQPSRVSIALEDDYHCMAVTLEHRDGRITSVTPVMERAPWTTCPGAVAVLRDAFEGKTLTEAARLGGKKQNCTHLYDLAVLAAAHASDDAPITFDILVADPSDDLIVAELRRNSCTELRWVVRDHQLIEPEELKGNGLFNLRDWIGDIPAGLHEAARLFQWGVILAHGRHIPMERQSDAKRMPPNCYTFQPDRARQATRVGVVHDFSRQAIEPLDHFNDGEFSVRQY